ncbi:maleylpyruvate isomerase N-terminal domain-containing protein [Streptomyces cellostaticus]|uniref:maleylpyruvate isomerase N-terminal domain-containing protein n=1 Tax=Streptomyces cellostaticus TaxID=67285 RepID=UPI0020264162|nr:maleylpyruvate isomerase N-terminal domain-containing protein [Streptomyces cellostaticus]
MNAQTYVPLPVDRCTSELRREAARFADAARDLPLTEPVPACPGWTLGDLVRHLRQGHEWATTILATRSTTFVLPGGDPDGGAGDGTSWTERVAGLGARQAAQDGRLLDPALRTRFVTEGADRLIEAIEGIGPEVPVWAPHGRQNKEFWPRWAMYETSVHRADVDLLAGRSFELATDVALDCVDFCVAAFGVPEARPFHSPLFAEVPRGGETLRFRSAWGAPGRVSNWLVTCAPDGVRVTRAAADGAPADVTVVASPSDLLLVVKGRLRPRGPRVTVSGDRELLEFWLEHAVS